MKKSPAITKSDAVGEEEEDYVALIHLESHSRKNDVALAAAVSKEKSSTSNNGFPTEELHLRSQQLLVVAYLFRGLQEETKQLQLRGGENHVKIYTMTMSGLQRKLLDIRTQVQPMDAQT